MAKQPRDIRPHQYRKYWLRYYLRKNKGKTEGELHERDNEEYKNPSPEDKRYEHIRDSLMQTILTNNKFRFGLPLILSITLQTTAAGVTEQALAFQLEKNETIYIGGGQDKIVANCNIVVQLKSLRRNIKNILQRSSETFPIFSQPFDGGHYLVLASRIPSKLPQSTGYCGAGYEDHLVLLVYEKNQVKLLDDFLLQSCLKSLSLDSNGDDHILNAISIDKDKYLIGFRWLNSSEKERILSISNGKFALK